MKKRSIVAVAGCLLLGGVLGIAQLPESDISASRHPNLAAAQKLCQQAWEKVAAAQKANDWDMEGHAQKAKDLLDQASHELKLAAEEANRHKK
jgi:hypothetical protein